MCREGEEILLLIERTGTEKGGVEFSVGDFSC
jgi:hypothetical protein